MLRLDASKKILWVDVDSERPCSWRAAPYYEQLKRWSATVRSGQGVVMVADEGEIWVLFPERDLLLPDAPRNTRFEAGYREGPHGPEPWAHVVPSVRRAAA